MADTPSIRVDSRLSDTPMRNRTFTVPDLLSDLVDELVDRAANAGYTTGRAQIVAGLIFAARNVDSDEIESVVRAYLTAHVRDVAGDRAEDGVVRTRPATPGRRPST